jgi:hypothetical protein
MKPDADADTDPADEFSDDGSRYAWLVPLVAALAGLCIGAPLVTHITGSVLLGVAAALMLACIMLGWILTLQNDAFEFPKNWWWDRGRLRAKEMAQPLELSFTMVALLAVAGLLGGCCLRLIWIVFA